MHEYLAHWRSLVYGQSEPQYLDDDDDDDDDDNDDDGEGDSD